MSFHVVATFPRIDSGALDSGPAATLEIGRGTSSGGTGRNRRAAATGPWGEV